MLAWWAGWASSPAGISWTFWGQGGQLCYQQVREGCPVQFGLSSKRKTVLNCRGDGWRSVRRGEAEGAASFQPWGDEGDFVLLSVDMHWREGMEKGRDTEISYRNKFLGEHLYIVDCFYSRFLIPWVVEQKFCCTGIRQKTYTHYFFAPV